MVDRHATLANILARRDGTVAYPKNDGRIEIPQGIVRLMGWKDGSTLFVWRVDGGLSLREIAPTDRCGFDKISISMGRARIPRSMLRMASMDAKIIVLAPDLTSGSVYARPYILNRRTELETALRELEPKFLDHLHAILTDSAEDSTEAPVETEPAKDVAEPKLFLPDFKRPTVIRVIGQPFSFAAHWVSEPSCGTKGGAIAAHRRYEECPYCDKKSPETMCLVPVVRRRYGKSEAGYLLTHLVLKNQIARALKGGNPTECELTLIYSPYSDGSFKVFHNPTDGSVFPDEMTRIAQELCDNPDGFLASVFFEHSSPVAVDRFPTVLAANLFDDRARPRNLVE